LDKVLKNFLILANSKKLYFQCSTFIFYLKYRFQSKGFTKCCLSYQYIVWLRSPGVPQLKKGGSKWKRGPSTIFWQNKRKMGDISAILDIKKQKNCFNVTLNYEKIFFEPENKRYTFLIFSLATDWKKFLALKIFSQNYVENKRKMTVFTRNFENYSESGRNLLPSRVRPGVERN